MRKGGGGPPYAQRERVENRKIRNEALVGGEGEGDYIQAPVT